MCVCAHARMRVHSSMHAHARAHVQVYICHSTRHLRVRDQHFRSLFSLPTLFWSKVSLFCVSAIALHTYAYTILSLSLLSASYISTGNTDAHNGFSLLCEFQGLTEKHIKLVVTPHTQHQNALWQATWSSETLLTASYMQSFLGTWVLVSDFQWDQLGSYSCWSSLAMAGGWPRLALAGTLDYLTLLHAPHHSAACPHKHRGENTSILSHLLVNKHKHPAGQIKSHDRMQHQVSIDTVYLLIGAVSHPMAKGTNIKK